MNELALTRRNGYAQVRSEWFEDLVSVAAPVRNYRGDVIAALAVGMPESRCDKARIALMGKAAIKAADRISAYYEATRLAGFAAEEACKFFGDAHELPGDVLDDLEQMTAIPARAAQAAFLDRFHELHGA